MSALLIIGYVSAGALILVGVCVFAARFIAEVFGSIDPDPHGGATPAQEKEVFMTKTVASLIFLAGLFLLVAIVYVDLKKML